MKHVLVLYLGTSESQKPLAESIASQFNLMADDGVHSHAIDLTQVFANSGQLEYWVKNATALTTKMSSGNDLVKWLSLQGLKRLKSKVSKSGIHSNVSQQWQRLKPDMIISLAPVFTEVLKESLNSYKKEIPFLVLTPDGDKADKLSLWCLASDEIHYALNNKWQQPVCKELGIKERNTFLLSGKPIALEDTMLQMKERLFREWGFRSDWPTCFVYFGFDGSAKMISIAKEAIQQGTDANFIYYCGGNGKLLKKMKSLQFHRPVRICKANQTCPSAYTLISDFVIADERPSIIDQAQLAGIASLIHSPKKRNTKNEYPELFRFSQISLMLESVQVESMLRVRKHSSLQNRAMKELLSVGVQLMNQNSNPLGRVVKLNSKSRPADRKVTGMR